MLSTVLVTLAVLVGGAVAETIVYCGSQPYYPSQYTCYNGFLCPVVSGERTRKCGGACYLPEAYTCTNGQLGQHPYTSHPFEIVAKNSIPYLNGKPVNAIGQHFYIGQPSATYRPISNCSIFTNTTVLTASGHAMDVEVPGGQQTYVESNGAFGFTQAHSAYVPPGADIAGVAAYDRGYLVTTKGSGWTACQTAGSTSGPAPAPPLYKIFARLPGLAFNASCVNLNIVTVGKAGNVYGAWQYT